MFRGFAAPCIDGCCDLHTVHVTSSATARRGPRRLVYWVVSLKALGDCLGLPLPVASAANEQFKRARPEHGDEDFCAVFAASKK